MGSKAFVQRKLAERQGFEPWDPISQVNFLAGSSNRPLWHLSKTLSESFGDFYPSRRAISPTNG